MCYTELRSEIRTTDLYSKGVKTIYGDWLQVAPTTSNVVLANGIRLGDKAV